MQSHLKNINVPLNLIIFNNSPKKIFKIDK